MAGKFEQALKANALPRRLGDVQLQYETSLWVGRADRPPRGRLSYLGLAAGGVFAAATLGSIVTRADPATVGLYLLPSVLGFGGAAWLEQRDRRQRAFAVDFAEHFLRLDFSTPITGMPRTLHVPFEQVLAIELEEQGGALTLLTIEFEVGKAAFREVLAAGVSVAQLKDAERVRRMLRAAVGLEKAPEPSAGPPPVVDTFG